MNRFSKSQPKKRMRSALLWPVLSFVCAGVAFILGINSLSGATSGNEAATLAQTIARSSVHCYALEGVYPQSLNYLKEHYGLSYREERYFVDYRCFARNIMPEITVVEIGGTGNGQS